MRVFKLLLKLWYQRCGSVLWVGILQSLCHRLLHSGQGSAAALLRTLQGCQLALCVLAHIADVSMGTALEGSALDDQQQAKTGAQSQCM